MREVIQVERASDGDPTGIAELIRVADELLPPLAARLGVSELGEIEVRGGAWRVRVRRAIGAEGAGAPALNGAQASNVAGAAEATRQAATASSRTVSSPGTRGPAIANGAPPAAAPGPPMATSTAVGYFAVKAGIVVGQRVARGDVLGWVDVLGMRKEIVSPEDGVVARFETEPGDPVEYGQELVSLLGAGVPADPGAT